MAYTTIDDPSAYFQTALYTGTGSGQQVINDGNSDLQPDWIWVKRRDSLGYHQIIDSSRGGTKRLWSNDNGAEGTQNNVASFDSDGFTAGNESDITPASTSQVAWQWKCNGGSRTTFTESGNNPGGGYQANTTAGFSIVDYTGTANAGTVSHGLGAVPHMIIFKNRDQADDWGVYHHKNTAAPETDFLKLNTTDATTDSANVFNDTAPTSSVFTVNIAGTVNEDAEKYIAYCFAPIQGYSKFGSYTGNGNANAPFIYTGFKPSFLIIKNTSDGDDQWLMWDNKRSVSNPVDDYLEPSTNASESANSNWAIIDFVSNGFKLRSSDISYNQSGYKYIYMAFAEHPFVSSEGVPTTAR